MMVSILGLGPGLPEAERLASRVADWDTARSERREQGL
jgi:hypothetical protein